MSQYHDDIGLHETSIDRPWPRHIVKTDGIAGMATFRPPAAACGWPGAGVLGHPAPG
jgi:hypothetical protein